MKVTSISSQISFALASSLTKRDYPQFWTPAGEKLIKIYEYKFGSDFKKWALNRLSEGKSCLGETVKAVS